MLVTFEVSQPLMSSLKLFAFRNISAISVTFETFQPEMLGVELESTNILLILVTFETFQPDKSWSKLNAL